MQTYTTHISISAPARHIWDIITKPEYIKQVLDVQLITEWQIGGPISYVHEFEGQVMRDKGIVLALEQSKLIKLSYLPALIEMEDIPENYQVITAELTENDGMTELKITTENIQDEFFRKHAPEIWGDVLRGLKAVAEASQ